jgi:hypothetical protein
MSKPIVHPTKRFSEDQASLKANLMVKGEWPDETLT